MNKYLIVFGSIFALGFLIIAISVAYYLTAFTPRKEAITQLPKRQQLLDVKKEQYWGFEQGKESVVFNSSMGTCLVLNIYVSSLNTDGNRENFYFISVKNLANDATLL